MHLTFDMTELWWLLFRWLTAWLRQVYPNVVGGPAKLNYVEVVSESLGTVGGCGFKPNIVIMWFA